MEPKRLREALEIWQSASERPYQALIEDGYYEEFLEELSRRILVLEKDIYRGTDTRINLELGEIFEYTYPTSWSFDYDCALNFVKEYKDVCVLHLRRGDKVHGIINNRNEHGEEEFILDKMRLKVVNKYIEDNEDGDERRETIIEVEICT